MTADIRATLYCDLGEVISGGFSDDHVQGTGLIRTRGDIVIKGLVKPSYGQLIQLGWQKGTVFSRVPRALRVLSYFADPFRRTTTIQLGCKLTLLENKKPAAEKDRYFYSKEDDNNKDLDCQVYDVALLPISASSIAYKCLSQLGIAPADSLGLSNYYAAEKFDLTNGYVAALNDLLYAESLVGFLQANETLKVVDLRDNPSIVQVLSTDSIIDVGPITGGEPPVDAVGVRYSYTRYQKPESVSTGEDRWELVETTDELQKVVIKYDSERKILTVAYNPYTRVETSYDRFDRPTKVVTTERRNTVELNSTYVAQLLDAKEQYRGTDLQNPSLEPQIGPTYTVQELYYDYARAAEDIEEVPGETAFECLSKDLQASAFDSEKDSQYIRTRKYTYVSDMEIAGALNVSNYVFYNPVTEALEVLHPGTIADRLAEYEEVNVETIEVEEPGSKTVFNTGGISTGTTQLKDVTIYNRTITVTKRARYKEQQFQQFYADRGTYVDSAQAQQDLIDFAAELFSTATAVNQTSSKQYDVIRRPTAAEVSNSRNSKGIRTAEDVTEVEFVTGSETSNNSRVYDLPLAPDDRIQYLGGGIPGSWSVTQSDAQQKAVAFARAQNRLNLGHRYGFSLQLPAGYIPAYPLDGIGVNASGAMALFLANGISWAFDSNGIVCNTDAIYWSGLGSTDPGYQIWFQVQPGITLLPSVTPSTNPTPSPVNSETVATDFDPNTGISSAVDYDLITDAVTTTSNWGSVTTAAAQPYIDWNDDLDGWSLIPYDTAPVYSQYLSTYAVIPAYLEKVTQVLPVVLEADVVRVLSSLVEVPLEAMVIRLEITIPVIKPTIYAPVKIQATVSITIL